MGDDIPVITALKVLVSNCIIVSHFSICEKQNAPENELVPENGLVCKQCDSSIFSLIGQFCYTTDHANLTIENILLR